MNNNQNEPKQLDCSLFTCATASLNQEVVKDLSMEDGNLEVLLGKEQDAEKTAENNRQDNN